MKKISLLTVDDVKSIVGPIIASEVRKAFEILEGKQRKHAVSFDGEPAKDDESINILNLGVRAANAMDHIGIRTIGELCSLTEADLLNCRNFGMTRLFEVKFRLAQVGRQLS